MQSGFGLDVAKTVDVDPADIVVHDPSQQDSSYSFALSRLSDQNLEHTVMGIFRQVNRPVYNDEAQAQLAQAMAATPHDTAALQSLLRGRDTWTVD